MSIGFNPAGFSSRPAQKPSFNPGGNKTEDVEGTANKARQGAISSCFSVTPPAPPVAKPPPVSPLFISYDA